LQLSAITVPDGVTLVADDLDEVTIATLSPPRVEEEPEPSVEEEAELVGEEGEAAAAEDGGGEAGEGESGDSDGEESLILIVGTGNSGRQYGATRHNVGFEVGAELSRRWQLPKAKSRYGGLIAEGRAGAGGPRVAILLPQTYMNDSGDSVGPARGSLKVPLDRVVVLHDEIDLPFGEVQSRLGGGLAGHNGLKSLRAGFGHPALWPGRGGGRKARLARPRDRLGLRPRELPRAAGRGRGVDRRRRRRGRGPGRAARFHNPR